MAELDHKTLTINEYRKSRGREEVEWGHEPEKPPAPVMPNGVAPEGEEEPEKPKPKKPPEKEEEKKIAKKEDINPGTEVVEEAKDYGQFYEQVVDKWEATTLKALKEVPEEKMYEADFNKTFGEFVRMITMGVTTAPFVGKLSKYIKAALKTGLNSAEEELDIDIGFTPPFDKTLKALEKQQLDGYMLSDGTQWHGIKGATKQLQLDILKTVEEDVVNKVSREDMTQHIKDVFEGSTTSQAKRIARTEATRS